MNTPTPTYYYPNRMGRIILLSLEEIIGRNGVNAVLNRADLPDYIGNYPPHNQDFKFPFKHVSQILGGLEALYGPHGGQGIALRSGRSCFQYGLREFGPLFGLTDLTFRLLPLQTKLKVGGNSFAKCSTGTATNESRSNRMPNIFTGRSPAVHVLGTADRRPRLPSGGRRATGSALLGERRQVFSRGRDPLHRSR